MAQASQGDDAERPSVLMAFACENVTTEPGTPVSFQNIMDGVSAPDFPAPTGRWLAIFCFYSPQTMTITNCRVIVTDDRDNIIAQTALRDLSFAPDRPISRNIVRFFGPAWPYPGRYFVAFVANRNDVLASFPMWVQHVPAEDDETGEPGETLAEP